MSDDSLRSLLVGILAYFEGFDRERDDGRTSPVIPEIRRELRALGVGSDPSVVTRVLYFGTDEGAGHYFWGEGMQKLRASHEEIVAGLPWQKIDGQLPPQPSRSGVGQGVARVHHRDGWTALAWWDYSGDSRPGSNAAFFFDALLEFGPALTQARTSFPQVFARFTYDVVPEAT